MFRMNKNIATPATQHIFQPYNDSEILALSLGFVEVQDERAFHGRYFIKNGKKWIHNIEALRRKLNNIYSYYITDEELAASTPEGFGYDVETYYTYHAPSKNPVLINSDYLELMKKIKIN